MRRTIFNRYSTLLFVSAIVFTAFPGISAHAEDTRDLPLIGTPEIPVPEA